MAAIHVAALLSHPAVRSAIERALAARGVRGDTMIAHIDPREAAMLRFMGGAGTINPRTGLRQFFVGGSSGDTAEGGIGGGLAAGGDTSTGAQASAGGGIGGYGQADRGAGGSGLGAAGGRSGESGAPGSAGSLYSRSSTVPIAAVPAPVAPINNMPAAAPVSLTPMMSSTATTDLASSRFGVLPSWATTPYQIGMAPSSYPTPGVNAALGAPGTGGGTVPGGGGTVPGSAASGSIGPGGGLIGAVNAGGYTVLPPGSGVGPGGTGAVSVPGGLATGYSNQGTIAIPSQQQYVAQLMQKLGLAGRQAAPATQAAAQPIATKMNFTAQAAPGAIQQLHPAVQQALAQGILGGAVQTPANIARTAQQKQAALMQNAALNALYTGWR